MDRNADGLGGPDLGFALTAALDHGVKVLVDGKDEEHGYDSQNGIHSGYVV